MIRVAAIACALLGLLPAAGARAALPDDHQVVVAGLTLDERTLPTVLALPTGAASTIGLDVAMKLVPHDADDWLVHDTTDGTTRVVAPQAFHAPAITAAFYDPGLRATRSARVMPGTGTNGPRISVDGSPAQDMTSLLDDSGAMLVFQMPEPGLGAGLATGVCLLSLLARRKRR